ncbi:Maf family protein [Candidatus Gottesmanbacteria bacterium]|nr:Maf family protein [Candidatus Gottesmanbacteria bacterium]
MNLHLTRSNEPLPPPPIDVVLASQSVGRKTLLEKMGLRFRVVHTRLDEDAITHADPLAMIKKRALAKADEVTKHPRVYTLSEEHRSLVIAADSMAIVGKKTFGKAKDRDDAREILKALMDRTHVFATALVVTYYEGQVVKQKWEKVTQTKVTLRKLTSPELESYVTRYDFTRFAAGYALNETPWDLVTKIDGSYTNVIGLPFEVLLPILRKLEIIL